MSTRSIWTGFISWQALSIGVKLTPTVREEKVELHQVHRNCGGAVGYHLYCKTEDVPISRDEIAKGVEFDKDDLRIVPEELLDGEESKVIDLSHLAPLGSTCPSFQKEYWLVPDGPKSRSRSASASKSPSLKPYHLLREMLVSTGSEAVVSFTMRARTHLARIIPRGEGLILQVLPWPAEVLEEPEIPSVELSDPELDLGRQLAGATSRTFDPAEWTDTFSERIRAHLEGEQPAASIRQPEKVTDLMAALTASVKATDTPAKKTGTTKRTKVA
jgi:DNA end-binding protein Ku